VHTLAFLDPGHFHAALTLGERHPRVRDEVVVHAPRGPELDDFLGLVDGFNRRRERPTGWRVTVRAGGGSLERLIAERSGDVVVLAGRNDRKPTTIRRLHDAGLHVLADKPWMAAPDGLDDLRHVLAAPPAGADRPLAVEMMTGRHEITAILAARLLREPDVFGGFADDAGEEPGIEIASVHHLEKTVDGRPLRRPPWFFDVRVQGDGIADIPTHMVDQAQRLVRAAAATPADDAPRLELLAARTWSTPVPRALFARVTGRPGFPPDLAPVIAGSELAYRGNAALAFRAGPVRVALDTRWDLSVPPGGGDTHRSVIRGTRSLVRVEQDPATGFRRRLSIEPRGEPDRVRAALERALAAWRDAHPGLSLVPAARGWEIRVPPALDTGHERQFPLVLAEFLTLVESGRMPPRLAADTLAKYTLLAQAAAGARPHAAARP